MRSFWKKSIIYIWIFSILINACPVIVFASFLEKEEIIKVGLEKESGDSQSSLEVVGEIKEKRTLNEKHYLLEDGSIKAFIYPENIHYEENGEYIDIDNTLISTTSGFKNKKSNFSSEFLKEESKLNLTYKGHKISWKMKDAKKRKGEITGNLFSKINIVPSLESKITYSNVFDNIDLEYEIISNRIEENIIIHDKESLKNEFIYFLETDLVVKELKKNELAFLDNTGKEVFYISSPVMYDSNLEFSSDILLTPKKVENGYEILLEANLDWLSSDERIYPITIDPVIVTDLSRDEIKDTYIYPNDATNTGKGNAHILRVGSTSYSNINTNKNPFRSLIQFSLPSLSSGDQVIKAELHIFNYQNTDSWTPPSGDVQIDIHAVTKSWNESNAYWNNMKDAYNSQIVDYIKYGYDSKNQNKENTADITSLVKDWYVSGNNYGLLLKEHVEKKVSGRNDVSFISSDTSSAYTTKRPYVVIHYRNQTGLENYLTTHTQNIGNTTVYTNDYNGNLTLIHQDTSTPGNRLPVSINHVYNTNDKDTNIGYGNGFRLNLNQTLESKTISGISYLLYIDEDATRHYFYKENNIWKDEDGLDLTIIASGTNYIMKDKGGNTSTFTKNGTKWYLKEMKDTNNNKITIQYASNYNHITSVTDGAGDTLTLTYTNNLLTSIKDSDNRVYKYAYTSNNLTSITYPDSLKTEYQYTSSKLLSKVIDVDKSSISYTYYSKSPYRVKSITEYGNSGTAGSSLTIGYSANTTVFKDNKDHIEAYTFNNLGHTLSINTIDSNHTLKTAYGTSYQYGTSGSNKNKLLLETNMSKTTQNLFLNSGAENKLTNWKVTGSVIATTNPYFGTNSFQLASSNALLTQSLALEKKKEYTISFYGKGNGSVCISFNGSCLKKVDMKEEWDRYSHTFQVPETITGNVDIGFSSQNGDIFLDNVQLEEGESLNPYNIIDNGDFHNGLSGWTKNANVTTNDKVVSVSGVNAMNFKGELGKSKNIYEHAYLDGKKGDTYQLSYWVKNTGIPLVGSKKARILVEFLNGSEIVQALEVHAYPDSKNWQYASGEIVAKQDYKRIKITATYNNNASNIYYTNISLFKDDVSNSYTYDENGNIISTKDLANQNSTYQYSKKNELIGATNPKGRKFYYEYDYSHTNRLLQAVNQSGLTLKYQYDTYGNIIKSRIEAPSMIRKIEDIKENEYYYLKPVSSNLKVGKSNTDIKLLDENQKWKFQKSGDNYSIIDESNASIAVKGGSATSGTTLQLEDYNNSAKQRYKVINNDDGTFTFQTEVSSYKSCINVVSSSYNKNQALEQYTCNKANSQKFMIVPIEYQTKYIESSAEYTENGNYQTKVIDQKGDSIITNYNESRGTISDITDARGNKIEYTYDIMDRITSIKSNDIINTYTYDKDYLKKITHNNFDYEFIKDEYGNTISITVAGTPLITHQYEANNGYLLKSIYGNNDSIHYEYDPFGRISKQTNTTGTATYTYNNRGSLSSLKYLGKDYYYTYDLSGRITSIKENNFEKKYNYDNYNNLDKVKYKYDNTEKEVSYTYDADDKLTMITYPNYKIKYTYDNLDRLIKKEIIRKDKTYTTTYEYYDIDEYKTTTLLKSITNGDNKLEYNYDSNGNITNIKKNGIYQKRYSYDSLNQLKREYTGKFYSYIGYTYDLGGNLKQKYKNNYDTMDMTQIFNYLIPSDSRVDAYTPSSTDVLGEYQYSDIWKDQLVQVDDSNITYDSIGNMTSYNGYNYTWTNGNELKRVTTGNNQYDYEYNIEGIRTKKTVNGKETEYYLEGTNIIYEKRDGKIIEYSYDESGISGIRTDNKEYSFVKNIQGDIIEVLDEEFNVVAEYTYDAWGVVRVNNLTEDKIGDINPYRYRGYYYDTETNLYYLNSRYYNPVLGRFISADSILGANGDILEYNLYIYCSNNPIVYSDPSGENFVDALPNWLQWLEELKEIIIPAAAINPTAGLFVIGGIAVITIAKVGYDEITEKSKKSTSKSNDNEKHTVYFLRDIISNEVKYVGRSIHPDIRAKQHFYIGNKAGLYMDKVVSGLSKYDAISMEQFFIEQCDTIKKGDYHYNQRNEISLNRPDRKIRVQMAHTYIDENEIRVNGCGF